MILAILLLLTGLFISSVAIYYSVVGLAAIFAASAIPVYIMGTTLEIAKLVGASWLKSNWNRVPKFIKIYMCIAIVVLMAITSMGIFGFLARGHSDSGVVSGDVLEQVATIDEKIKTERDNIEATRKVIAQMDASVDQLMARTDNEQGAVRANAIRRSQAKDRAALQKEISDAQQQIRKLNDERAPIAKSLRKVESEVGPIKYLAQLIYGDNPDPNILEKAVTWVIILIVIVFDPLAVVMLLAAQMAFAWYKEDKKNQLVEMRKQKLIDLEEQHKEMLEEEEFSIRLAELEHKKSKREEMSSTKTDIIDAPKTSVVSYDEVEKEYTPEIREEIVEMRREFSLRNPNEDQNRREVAENPPYMSEEEFYDTAVAHTEKNQDFLQVRAEAMLAKARQEEIAVAVAKDYEPSGLVDQIATDNEARRALEDAEKEFAEFITTPVPEEVAEEVIDTMAEIGDKEYDPTADNAAADEFLENTFGHTGLQTDEELEDWGGMLSVDEIEAIIAEEESKINKDEIIENAVHLEDFLVSSTIVDTQAELGTADSKAVTTDASPEDFDSFTPQSDKWKKFIEAAEAELIIDEGEAALIAEEQNLKKKTYMTKDQNGKIQIHNRH